MSKNMATAVKPFFRTAVSSQPKTQSSAPRRRENEAPAPLFDDNRVNGYVAHLSENQRAKLKRLIEGETRRLGFQQVREGGPVWLNARRRVVSNLIAHEVDLDEIYFEESDIESKLLTVSD